ncbi:MAG TPA: FMN-binding negative transcriptional regulator [Terriglobales bacterium]|nr:FMN-binding negative transcriptional regulator [Terriglobales bacterium]
MYIPEFNRIEDQPVAVAFMRANPFAILISNNGDAPFATHLPVMVSEANGQVIVRAHVAKANPHWKILEQESLLIFHGPHAYVSPALYEIRESVPTWNYATVHVYGHGKILLADTDKHQVLSELILQFDSSYLQQWNSFDEQYRSRMLNHIVAFEIAVTRIETKFKLSQNRTSAEQENVIQALGTSPDPAVSGVAELMRKRGLGAK